MRIVKDSSARVSRVFSAISSLFIAGLALVTASSSVSILGCSHAWDDYDPRGGTTASSSSSSGGSDGKCGGTSVLVSDFDQGNLDALWEINDWGGATISESAGELVAKLAVNSPNDSGAYVISKYYYDFRDDFASIEVSQMPNTMNATWSAFSVGPDSDNYAEIYQEESTINFGMKFNGVYDKYLTLPYDATTHRFWRMRGSNNRVYYETSPDGETWKAQIDIPMENSFSLEYCRIVIASGSAPDQASPGEAHFDRLNGGGVPKQKYCPMSSIRDDFNDEVQSDQWLRSYEGQPDMLTEEGGQLVISYVANQAAYAGLTSAYAFDLTGSSIVLEVPVAPAEATTGYVGLDLNGPGDNDVEMFMTSGSLKMVAEVDGIEKELAVLPYSPQDHRWWRIREAANTVYWETSPDGKTWTERLQVSPPPVPVSTLDVEIHGGTLGANADPGECRADNLNVPAP